MLSDWGNEYECTIHDTVSVFTAFVITDGDMIECNTLPCNWLWLLCYSFYLEYAYEIILLKEC